ncbi:MAG: glutathione S-transferase family protein [Candidatus Devosia phytovorans]|uniref:Glutathione S-transferase family protein n=1 Tax=Candidatus Devosia phytovorans TaxID=3121372 RepID=A0AAJ5VZD6_9HYPH|nr:glutathione S-transferase family protein [Devosia sp.]WEK06318.1 MAG: glutathione S-transferase family protein [Devosia sp.]
MIPDLTLWGRKSSCNVQKALWALEELELPYQHRPAGGSDGGLDDPAFRRLNPNGLVPVLQDGDFALWESHSILRYLAASYGRDRLWREDPRQRALVDQWTDWTATTFQPAWIAAFWLIVRTPKAQHDAKAIAAALGKSIAALRLLDVALAERDYLAGDRLSYADIAAGVALYRWFSMEIDRPAMPGVENWYRRLQERPAFRKAIMVSYAELVGKLAF